jgi:predicted RecB family nuclease
MAFAAAWEFMQSRPGAAIYYYSHYEKTYYSKLQKLYPDVVSEQQLQAFFESDLVVDLYTDVVKKKTEWPTYNYSIKTLAKYLGFQWRDTDPSGASSIEWYHRWTEDGDDEVKQRILDYNEDDCVATRVLVEGVRGLESD